jgi:hypothetical protein
MICRKSNVLNGFVDFPGAFAQEGSADFTSINLKNLTGICGNSTCNLQNQEHFPKNILLFCSLPCTIS